MNLALKRLTIDEVGVLLAGILRDAYDIWKEPQNLESPTADSELSRMLTGTLDRILGRLMVLGVDMGAVEFRRAFISPTTGDVHEPVVKITAGKLSELFSRHDFYTGQTYPFLRSREDAPFGLKILGSPKAAEDLRTKEYARPNLLVTTLDLIDRALAGSQNDADGQVTWLLQHTPMVVQDCFKSPHSLRMAATAALFSTKYSRSLMTDEVFELPGKQLVDRLGLPHRDERNLLYVPVFVHDECIGGAAVYSHYELPEWGIPIVEGSAHILLYRTRSGDDIAAAALAAKSKAQWDATLLYTHRLAHDVRKPAEQLQATLSDALTQYRDQIPELFADALDGVVSQLTHMRDLIATRVGVTVEELREQARRDARPDSLDQLLADATWLWRLRARRESKTIATSVLPDPDVVVRVPRYLVVEVLENLVSNAIRFAKTRVSVKAEVSRTSENRLITFTVSDDGIGIPEKTRKRLATPYYATDPTLPGLGLQLSRFIIRDLLDGSDIQIAPSRTGATVTFTIPEMNT